MTVVILILIVWILFAFGHKIWTAEKEEQKRRKAEDIDWGLFLQMIDAFDRNDMKAVEEIKQLRIANKGSRASAAYIKNDLQGHK